MNRTLKIGLVVAIMSAIIAIFGMELFVHKPAQVEAGIPKIQPKNEPPYNYEYDVPSYRLLIGRKEGQPIFSLSQGFKKLDFNILNADTLSEEESMPITIVDQETMQSIIYGDGMAKISPSQDKIQAKFSIQDIENKFVLQIHTETLFGYGEEEGGGVVFKSKAGRSVFAIRSASLLDNSGKNWPMAVNIEGHLIADQSKELDNYYNISFVPEEPEGSDQKISYPATINFEILSLLHNRIVPIQPIKKDFKANEQVDFFVNVDKIPDESIKKAFADKNLSKLRFGIIDSDGLTKEVKAELVHRSAVTSLAIKSNDSFVKAGVFDLLVQHQDSSAYVAAEDFSWGVLALNPDQSVYQAGREATIDIAVLDSRGEVVCDAELVLEIKDPSGSTTTLSTSQEIITTEGCSQRKTELPDYTVKYKTQNEGTYALNLKAKTRSGEFSIADSLRVSNSEPYYLKRKGPTRIYPAVSYQMALEIDPRQSGMRIEEIVPVDFGINAQDGGRVETLDGAQQKIIWEKDLILNQTTIVSYSFDAPDLSPALFLVGKARVNGWQEERQWQIASDATTGNLFPIADGANDSASWTNQAGSACNTVACSDSVDETSGSDSNCSPTTDGDTTYITTSTSGAFQGFDINESSLPIGSVVTGATVKICSKHTSTGQGAQLGAGVCFSADCPNYTTQGQSTTYSGYTFNYTGLIGDDISDIEIRVVRDSGARSLRITRALIDLTYSPGTDSQMHHGNWFNSGTEQGFAWAN